ncbi:MAG: pyridoxal 5'-phosphate synthase glutaminase subunit PdxT [Bacillota bacterium]
MKIGVLALQGAFREHRQMLERCGCEVIEVRRPHHLEEIKGIIVPGGESTTIGKLLNDWELMEPLRQKGQEGFPIFGTCAGMIILAKEIAGSQQPRLALMDIRVIRNAYGRQVDSFEMPLAIKCLDKTPFLGVFIRAPYIDQVGPNVEVLASHDDKIVMVRQGNLLACSFHPELTKDERVHRYFLSLIG